MKFDILTIFPNIIYNYSGESILKRAQKAGVIKIEAHNFREQTEDKHRRVDDRPFGGGAGMVLQVQPIYSCLEKMGLVKNGKKIKQPKTKILIMDPAGKRFGQRMAEKFSKLDNLVFICGRYEGFDERVYKYVDEKISVGEYVLSGGELPALTIVEAVTRLLPGAIGNDASVIEETFGNKKNKIKAEYPQYTRPDNFMGQKVPAVLLSGDHKKIAEWREKKSK